MNNVKDLLDKHNVSAYKLHQLLGVSKAAVSKWVNQKSDPTHSMYLKILEVLGETDNSSQQVVYQSEKVVYVPVLSYVQAGSFTENEEFEDIQEQHLFSVCVNKQKVEDYIKNEVSSINSIVVEDRENDLFTNKKDGLSYTSTNINIYMSPLDFITKIPMLHNRFKKIELKCRLNNNHSKTVNLSSEPSFYLTTKEMEYNMFMDEAEKFKDKSNFHNNKYITLLAVNFMNNNHIVDILNENKISSYMFALSAFTFTFRGTILGNLIKDSNLSNSSMRVFNKLLQEIIIICVIAGIVMMFFMDYLYISLFCTIYTVSLVFLFLCMLITYMMII